MSEDQIDRGIVAAEVSAWCWEKGHENPNDGWHESLRESTWLRVFDRHGEPMKGINLRGDDGDYFIGYHSFQSCGDSLLDRIGNAGLLGFGSVHLYSLVGDKLYPSRMHEGTTEHVVQSINQFLEEHLKKTAHTFSGDL